MGLALALDLHLKSTRVRQGLVDLLCCYCYCDCELFVVVLVVVVVVAVVCLFVL
jgi:hypothetical protein